jgi:hypothetical protein
VVPPFDERSMRYPVASLLGVHVTSISVDDITVAETLVGAAGGTEGVVAVAVAEGVELPAPFAAITRYW